LMNHLQRHLLLGPSVIAALRRQFRGLCHRLRSRVGHRRHLHQGLRSSCHLRGLRRPVKRTSRRIASTRETTIRILLLRCLTRTPSKPTPVTRVLRTTRFNHLYGRHPASHRPFLGQLRRELSLHPSPASRHSLRLNLLYL
jgi:hypothetical protein